MTWLAIAFAAAAALAWAVRRALRWRAQEAARREQLEHALRQAEEARRLLDQKVAERLVLEERLQHDALHDALTGLPNRVLFLDRLQQAWQRSRRESGYRFAVLYFDLDRFKVINDTFGHETGDLLLQGIGKRLPDCLRPTDTVARLGGDEFAILLDGFRFSSEVTAIAERIQSALRAPFHAGEHEIYASASIGIADGVLEGQGPDEYVRDADVAMYAAKARGTHWERFDGAMHSPALARMRMETELRAAIERDQFFLVYQPIVEMDSTRIEGFEALLRWRHPTRGVVGPGEFIGLAEETRLILPLSLWVLRQACRAAVGWRARVKSAGPILSVNIAPQLMARPEMGGEILKVLRETGLSPRDLAVEITETALMASPRIASRILGELRANGLQVFIDDFGTGYSSLAYLTTLPVDRLKVDRSFVGSMDDESRLRVVRAIATLAHDLGKPLVAEGVETLDQLERLRALGCEFGQGWLFSRPVDAAQAGALLEAGEAAGAFPGLLGPPPGEVEGDALLLFERAYSFAPAPLRAVGE